MPDRLHLAPMPMGTVRVEASHDLVDRVNVAAARRGTPWKTASRVRQLPDGDVPVLVDSGAALQHIGSTSTPPGVGEAFASASSWAWARYQWAFQRSQSGDLLPTEDSLELRRHHAAVFSEHMGIGIGLTVLGEVLRRRHRGAQVTFHDLDFVLTGARFGLRNRIRRMPDYLAEVTFPSGRTLLYVVESKGQTRPSRHSAVDQLARALTQVVGMTARGRDLPSYVIGTRVYADGIWVQVVDPPEPLVVYKRTDALTSSPPPSALEFGERGIDLPVERLAARLASVRAGRALAAGGDYAGAATYLGSVIAGEVPGHGRELLVDGHELVGQSQTMSVLGTSYNAIRAVEAESFHLFKDGVDHVRDPRTHRPAAAWKGDSVLSSEGVGRRLDSIGVLTAVTLSAAADDGGSPR